MLINFCNFKITIPLNQNDLLNQDDMSILRIPDRWCCILVMKSTQELLLQFSKNLIKNDIILKLILYCCLDGKNSLIILILGWEKALKTKEIYTTD